MRLVRAGGLHHVCRPTSHLGLILALLSLVPLARARPPDPLWIAGLYDEIDLDQAVEAVGSVLAEIRTARVLPMHVDPLRATVSHFETAFAPPASLSTSPIRAPPGDTPFTI